MPSFMKSLLLFLFLSSPMFAQSVDAVADKVLVELQSLSTSWKTIKDIKTADAAIKTSKLQAEKLNKLATELKKYNRPSNAARKNLHQKRAKKVEAISLEMANTATILSQDAPLMAHFVKGLNELNESLSKSQKTFDLYFKPDSETPAEKK